jgi:hypothetical protein
MELKFKRLSLVINKANWQPVIPLNFQFLTSNFKLPTSSASGIAFIPAYIPVPEPVALLSLF